MPAATTQRRAAPNFIHAYARENIQAKLYSGLFQWNALMGMLALKGGQDKLTPDGVSVIGKRYDFAEKAKMQADIGYGIRWLSGKIGGGKWMKYEDTAASAGNTTVVDKVKTTVIGVSEREKAFVLRNWDIRFIDQGDKASRIATASAVSDAISLAMAEEYEAIGQALWTGSPTNQDDLVFDQPVGLMSWLHDSNVIGGTDRSLAVNAEFRAQRSTKSFKPELGLIDQLRLTGVETATGSGVYTKALHKISSKANTVLTTAENYAVLKTEALSKGAVRKEAGSMPAGAWVGFTGEYIDYNGVSITFCPDAPAGTFALIDPTDIAVHFIGSPFNVVGPKNLREDMPGTGQADITTGAITTALRMVVHTPKKHAMLTNVG